MQSPNWPYDQQQLASTVAPGSASDVVIIHPKRRRLGAGAALPAVQER